MECKVEGKDIPWLAYPDVWPTKSSYFVWLRGRLRSIWKDYPPRNIWKSQKMRPLTNGERSCGRFHRNTKKVGVCELCEEPFKGADLEVDHIECSDGCFDQSTAEKFLWHCVFLTGIKFQLVCKPCHKIKSYAERHGMTFEEARIEKMVISICQGSGCPERAWLVERGVKALGSKKERRAQVRNVLKRNVST